MDATTTHNHVCRCHGLPQVKSGKKWRCKTKLYAYQRTYARTAKGKAAYLRCDSRRVRLGDHYFRMPSDAIAAQARSLIKQRRQEFKARLDAAIS